MQNTGTVLTIVLVVVLAVLLLGGAGMTLAPHASAGVGFGMMSGGGMMGGYGSQFGFGFNPLGSILSLASWALIIGGIVLLVVWLARNAKISPASGNGSPLGILKARYARGEINKEQFDAIKRDVGGVR